MLLPQSLNNISLQQNEKQYKWRVLSESLSEGKSQGLPLGQCKIYEAVYCDDKIALDPIFR